MTIRALSQWEFDIYALSLSRGHGFGSHSPVGAWMSDDGCACGVVTQDVNGDAFGFLVMRRRVDRVWTVVADEHGFPAHAEACARMEPYLRNEAPPEPLPPATPARPPLFDFTDRQPGDIFRLLEQPSHHPARWTLNQLYLALPRPDRNWASDCRGGNFQTRLWEAHLLACFREQGLLVTQPYDSPDFRIENRLGGEAWVEAVTANPAEPYNHVNTPPSALPSEKEALFFGPAALRFAKTLGNKLARRYERIPHVAGKPFILAIADFHAPASMIWSREGLIGYLYGAGAQVVEIDGLPQAVPMPATHLLGPSAFPAGLFSDDRCEELSAVIFTNTCSIGKLNRVAVSGQGAPKGLRYTRIGNFFDRTPGALEGIPFCLDVTSKIYRGLWPHGYEPWSADLVVFHNPFARHKLPFDMVPEATHWFNEDGELVCRSVYETSILWSRTLITDEDKPAPRLEDFQGGAASKA